MSIGFLVKMLRGRHGQGRYLPSSAFVIVETLWGRGAGQDPG